MCKKEIKNVEMNKSCMEKIHKFINTVEWFFLNIQISYGVGVPDESEFVQHTQLFSYINFWHLNAIHVDLTFKTGQYL